jgi:hypothetical protein
LCRVFGGARGDAQRGESDEQNQNTAGGNHIGGLSVSTYGFWPVGNSFA